MLCEAVILCNAELYVNFKAEMDILKFLFTINFPKYKHVIVANLQQSYEKQTLKG